MKQTSFPVFFHSVDTKVNLPRRKLLKKFIADIFRLEKKKLGRIDYIFCTDDYLHQLNVKHLEHDTYTDIITFDLSTDERIVSEVYISVERVRENAMKFQESLLQELHRVIFHGALHLCGYKDKSARDQKLMRQKEEEYLKLYARRVPRGT